MESRGKTKKARTKTPGAQQVPESQETVERIRELLFGPQMRTLDDRFTKLEERLQSALGELRDEMRQRVDSLESFVKKELETLGDSIASEQNHRSEGIKGLSTELRNSMDQAEKRTSDLDSQIQDSAKESREQIKAQTKHLTENILKKHEEALQAFEASSDRIRADHIDRTNLSQLFKELALRLDAELTETSSSRSEEGGDD